MSYKCVRLKELRLEKGFTQKYLAELMSVPVAKISKWERLLGSPNIVEIALLSYFFDARISYIQGTSNVRKTPVDIPFSKIDKYIQSKEKEFAKKK